MNMDLDKSVAELALGRILGMMLRPAQEGDVAEYERCRLIILNARGDPEFRDMSPNYARDYRNF